MKNVNKVAVLATFALAFSGLAYSQAAFSVVQVPGASPNTLSAVNDSGQVMVNTGTTSSTEVSLWSRTGGAQAIAQVGTNSGGSCINNSGQVAGAGIPNSSGDLQAFIWNASEGAEWLGTLGGGLSAATCLNDAGWVVGYSYTASSSQHAFLWNQSSGMQDLTPTLSSIGGATAMGINSSDEVVGYYFPAGSNKTLGFTWTQDGGLQNLGLAGTIALAVNDSGTVVGQWPSSNGYNHAFRGLRLVVFRTSVRLAAKALRSASTAKDGL